MELQRAVWERESPPKMAPRPRAAALEGDSGLENPLWGAFGEVLTLGWILPMVLTLGWIVPVVLTLGWSLPARSSSARLQRGCSRRPLGGLSTGLSISRFLCQSCRCRVGVRLGFILIKAS